MKRVLSKVRDALADYTLGAVIAVSLTALARRQNRLERALPAPSHS